MGRVIVIEDNPVFADYVCGLLESRGFQSVSTSTCNGAKKLFAKMREDDIVLADLRLPDGDGIALLEELRGQGMNNPYIIMTDYDEVPTAVRGRLHTEEAVGRQPVPASESLAKENGAARNIHLRAAERGFPGDRPPDKAGRPNQPERPDIGRKRNGQGTYRRENTRKEQTGWKVIHSRRLRTIVKRACCLRPVRA